MAIRFIYLETAYSYNPKKNDYGNTGVPYGRSGWYVGSLTSVPNKVEQKKKLAYPFLWNSKPEALKRESLLNTFADGIVNIVYIRTKI